MSELTKKDRKQIAAMLNKGWESARVLRRAVILRELGQGQTAVQVARNVGVASKTVRAIARRYEEEGLESAWHQKLCPGQRRVARRTLNEVLRRTPPYCWSQKQVHTGTNRDWRRADTTTTACLTGGRLRK